VNLTPLVQVHKQTIHRAEGHMRRIGTACAGNSIDIRWIQAANPSGVEGMPSGFLLNQLEVSPNGVVGVDG
jgi:hypothetical protein